MRSEPLKTDRQQSSAYRQAEESGDDRFQIVDSSTLPVPTESDIRSAQTKLAEQRSFDSFYGYALAQASTDPLEAPMRSAMLRDPSSLQPLREDCGTKPPMVLVDLDPEGSAFDPQTGSTASPALVEVLAVLRSRNVSVAWIANVPASEAGAVRARLAQTGLDKGGNDLLLLTTTDLPSKQTLRRSLDDTACIVAIAGDAKSDFDELYDYLNAPDAAFALNEMFGEGWFLTPLPIH